jgi:hypothetical protein
VIVIVIVIVYLGSIAPLALEISCGIYILNSGFVTHIYLFLPVFLAGLSIVNANEFDAVSEDIVIIID